MSSRIDLTLEPCLGAGLIAAAPWLVLTVAAAALGSLQAPWLWLISPLALLGAGWQTAVSGLLRSPHSVVRLTVKEGFLQAQLADGRRFAALPASESRLFGGLGLLKLTLEGSTVKPPLVVIYASGASGRLAGNVPADDCRRLRVWLRLAPPSGPKAPA
ncbi:hypothetical protein [Marinobacter salicampi]|uniref:hypothetical protein n=1 Tax=Marinobacter salicampi TaxID=435907 RepID=UPI00140C29B4|nr:hypothetical protein [Marinobacter salicampi]